MYLLDTNVVSELRKPKPHGGVVAWLQTVEEKDLALSAVTIGEIQSGIERVRHQDPVKAREIEAWLNEVEGTLQVLPMDSDAFREWARLMDGRSDDLLEDAMIAATAKLHRLTIVTRNTRDFRPFGVTVLNPFTAR